MPASTAVRLTVIGSGDAFNSMGRGHSCYLLEGDGFGPLMVDFGGTALSGLRRLGREPTEIAGIAVTHLHGDHVGGFPFLIIDGMFNAIRTAPLAVLGPIGTAARIEDVLRLNYGDVVERERPFDLQCTEVAPGDQAQLVGTTVQAFAADHMDPPEQPLCLRISLPGGQVVAFSGDTAMCDGLFEAAAGADLLVADCSAPAPPCGRHCSWEQWREALPRIGTKRVLFTHLNRPMREQCDDLLAQAPAGFDLTFADDGLELTI